MIKKQPRNLFEQKIYQQLKKRKIKFKYEGEKITYLISGHYLPDFIIETKTGKIYIETKGYLRPESKRKMVAVKKLHPEIDLRILFYSKKKGSADKKNIRWAEKHGFKWAIDEIPEEWLDGF